MIRKVPARSAAGENPAITSKDYLSLCKIGTAALYASHWVAETVPNATAAVIGKEKARGGYARNPSVLWNRMKRRFVCPECRTAAVTVPAAGNEAMDDILCKFRTK